MQDREGQQGLVGLPAAMISTAFSASDQRLGGVQGPTLASPLRTRAPASLRVLHERGPEVGAEPVWSVMVCRLLPSASRIPGGLSSGTGSSDDDAALHRGVDRAVVGVGSRSGERERERASRLEIAAGE